MSLFLTLLLSGLAHSAEIYIEGPALADRAEAVVMSRSARDNGYLARVVKRHDEAQGWMFHVRVDGFDEKGPALTAAVELAESIGGNAWIFEVNEQGEAVRLDARDIAAQKVAEGTSVGSLTEEYAALQKTVDQHGGTAGGMAAVAGARSLTYEFRRTLPDGTVVDHLVAMRGADRFVQVTAVEGEVTSSKTILLADGAWLAVGEEAFAAQDREKTLETLEGFEPSRVIPFVLTFGPLSASRDEFKDLELAGTDTLDGATVDIMTYAGDQASSPMRLEVAQDSGLVMRVVFDGGALVHQFGDWGELASGVRIPGTVRTWRDGTLVDTIEVTSSALNGELDESWFAVPDAEEGD